MRIATLRAPGAPVTSASPIVIMTASTLPAANASIDGAYSNQSNLTSPPASLNQPCWIPISNAVHPGQSEKPTRSGSLAGAGGGAAGAAGGAPAGGGGGSFWQLAAARVRETSAAATARFFIMPASIERAGCRIISGALGRG